MCHNSATGKLVTLSAEAQEAPCLPRCQSVPLEDQLGTTLPPLSSPPLILLVPSVGRGPTIYF